MSIITIMLFGVVVFATHFLEGITGFGCTVLAMPFGIMLTGIKVAKPVLTIYGFLLCLYVAIISRKDIVWKEYFKILFFVGIGLPLGMWMFNKFPEAVLKRILAVFMIFVASRGLYLTSNKNYKLKNINKYVLDFLLFIGGCIHGAFTSGGPLVIIYATEAMHEKTKFRATLCMLWVTLNSIIIAQIALTNGITQNVLKLSLYDLPFLILGAILGNIAHYKVKDSIFTKMVYVVLLVSAVFMFI